MKASDYLAGFLRAQGVEQVFEMSGGMITHILDSCCRMGAPKVISMHHEQGAAFAADAIGRMTGAPGVAMATSGPGATNLLTGIGSCHFDSSPAVFITGQVNRHEQKGQRAIRQLGFQETDIVAMAKPITKAAWQVDDPGQLPAILAEAFSTAVSGRPGPVLVDIPMDVQRVQIDAEPKRIEISDTADPAAGDFVEQLLAATKQAKRPLILAGGGVRSALAVEAFRRFVANLGVPVVHSLMGVDLLSHGAPLRVGMIGSYGNRWANLALGRSDLVIVLGSRLDVRQTGADPIRFKGDRPFFHVDCEPGEINNRVTGCHSHVAHLRRFLEAAAGMAEGRRMLGIAEWLGEIGALREQWPDTGELNGVPGINPNVLMREVSEVSEAAAAYVVDVGQHQMWAAQSLRLTPAQRFLTSGGMGSMGFALPAAIGAAIACGRPVVVIAGDGGFQANIQELQTVVRNRLPIKIVVVNNQCHGMVRQFQQSYFEGRYQSTLWGYSCPDFERIAKAYGIEAATVSTPEKLSDAIECLWRDPGTPSLLQVMVDTQANAYPKLAFGKPITEMEPFSKPLDMEAT